MKYEPTCLPDEIIDAWIDECEELGHEIMLQEFMENEYSPEELKRICEEGD